MRFFKLYYLIVITFILSSCQSTNFFIANIPSYFSRHYHTYKNIIYGDKPWQKLDIYVPKNAENAPVITFFYGGGWYEGNKENYTFVADTLTKYGFIVVIPDYGKYPQQKYPAFEHDAALATLWIKNYIKSYQGDNQKMHLMGHSAGGHIAMMLLADKSFLNDKGLSPQIYQSFIGLSAPYHFEPTEKKYQDVFSDLTHYRQMQASHFIDGTEPPMLLIQGNQDQIVGHINIEHLTKVLDKHHNMYEIDTYDTDHTGTISALTNIAGVKNQKIIDLIVNFMKNNHAL